MKMSYSHYEENEYIKKYCDGKYSVFLDCVASGTIKPLGTEMTAYHDITLYLDTVRNIEIENRFYIGD